MQFKIFQDQRLFETKVIKENVVFEMPVEAQPAPICLFLKNTINSEMFGIRG